MRPTRTGCPTRSRPPGSGTAPRRPAARREISGATSTAYTVVEADLGATLTAKASWTDKGGFANTLASAPTSAVAASDGARPDAEHRGRAGDRGQPRDLHGAALGGERADGDGGLGYLGGDRRHGDLGHGLHGGEQHADLHAGPDGRDRHGVDDRGLDRRGGPDLHGEAVGRVPVEPRGAGGGPDRDGHHQGRRRPADADRRRSTAR